PPRILPSETRPSAAALTTPPRTRGTGPSVHVQQTPVVYPHVVADHAGGCLGQQLAHLTQPLISIEPATPVRVLSPERPRDHPRMVIVLAERSGSPDRRLIILGEGLEVRPHLVPDLRVPLEWHVLGGDQAQSCL